MKARPERSTGADPQGAVARAEAWRADEDRLAEVIAEARLVERAAVVRWLLDCCGGLEGPDVLAEEIDAGEHLRARG